MKSKKLKLFQFCRHQVKSRESEMIKVEVEVDLIFNADVKKSSVALFAFEDDVVTACASPEHVLCIT